MDLVTGAMGSLIPKLEHLLQDEYKLPKGVRKNLEFLAKEIKSTHLALCKVAQVPYDQLDPQVKLWAKDAREVSYDMEDVLDTFLVRIMGVGDAPSRGSAKRFIKKMKVLIGILARHNISGAIQDIMNRVDEMKKRRDRYMVDDLVSDDGVVDNPATTSSIDPRLLMTLYSKTSELVGMDEQRDALINMLSLGDDDASDKALKIVSIVGTGGLGKTTLAKVVYDKFTTDMNIYCKAFVPVGQNPDLRKVFRDILLNLDKAQYMSKANFMMLDERQLIEEIQAFLKEKRYFIVIDDIWDTQLWMMIRTALQDNNLGSKIMITSRLIDIARLGHFVYEMAPLDRDSSKILFCRRIFGSQDRCPEILSEVSDRILKKCAGLPLAIITIASLLANKLDDINTWEEVCDSIGSGFSSNNDMWTTARNILLLSYYDLPSHMKTCFVYLSMYPEDYFINRDGLIWRWIAEGFIQPQKKGDDIFELGKTYFSDLINRSLIQPVVDKMDDEVYGCHVHDLVLDLVCSLASEENFVTRSNSIDEMVSSGSTLLRRLALNSATTWPQKGVAQRRSIGSLVLVRSIVFFQSSFDSTPFFSCLRMVRVLDLEGCSLKSCGGSDFQVENLVHLRYLGLRGTGLEVLPTGIEKLQFLRVLKLGRYIELPEYILGLRLLMCLEGVRCYPQSGILLRNLESILVLDTLYLDKDSMGAVEALGHLTQLKVLKIVITSEMDQSFSDTLIDSLNKMPRLQMLQIFGNGFLSWECWTPPPHLRQLLFGGSTRMLPKWISPTSLPYLTSLGIKVHIVQPEDIQILGKLPSLVALLLEADYQNYLEEPLKKFVVSADAFPRLRRCNFRYVATVPSMFTRGAMSRVEDIRFCLRARDFFSNDGFNFDDLAMDHLPSLRYVACVIHSETDITGEEEMMKLRGALKQKVDEHPNHPVLFCY